MNMSDDDSLDDDTFICRDCGELTSDDEWNDDDLCDDCKEKESQRCSVSTNSPRRK